jgi:alpha-beta hydrolase superfamily lysophospholipase
VRVTIQISQTPYRKPVNAYFYPNPLMEKTKPKRRLPSIIRWILWVLLVQFVLVNISAALYAYKLTHFYTDPSIRNGRSSKNIIARTWKIFSGPRFAKTLPGQQPSFPVDQVSFTTKKGLTIRAWHGKVDSARGTVLMFHGVSSGKSLMLPEASAFREMGFDVLLVDFRGHGASDGKTTTLGYRETEEVKLAFDYVSKQGAQPVYLYGVSMGAVVVAKAVSEYSLRPAGVIMEMPYASLSSHLQARARTLGFPGFPERPFGFLVSHWIGWERGFRGRTHQTTRYVKDLPCPVLLQWGARDDYVLEWEIQAIFHAIKTRDKKLAVYPGAGHESLLRNDPATWKLEVGNLLK